MAELGFAQDQTGKDAPSANDNPAACIAAPIADGGGHHGYKK